MTPDVVLLDTGLFALTTVRTAGVVIAAPLLWADAPMQVRGALVVALGLVSYGAAAATAPAELASVQQLVLAAPGELLLGTAMGMVVRIAVGIVETVGDICSPLLGFGAATLFDPHAQISETGLTKLLRLLALSLALLVGAHRILIGGLLASYRMVPLGAATGCFAAFPLLLHLSAAALTAGVRLAIPIFGALLLIQLGLAFVSRAAPAMQLFSIGFAVCLVAGVLLLLIVLPDIAREIEITMAEVGTGIDGVLAATAAAGP
jgi:flagellar biosynthetic protein FliR